MTEPRPSMPYEPHPIIRGVFTIFLTLGIWSGQAWGADSHCALDTDDNGSVDSWCTDLADADFDGYTTAEGDCDDNDPHVWPGAPLDVNGCSAGQWRQCQTGGAGWSSCTATGYLDEATGSGSNYFIDPVSGNDTTGNGTSGNPWKSLKNLGYWASGAPGTHVGFTRGDVVYVKEGAALETYNPGYAPAGTAVTLATRNFAASGSTTVRIRNYPGERPQFCKVYNEGTSYFQVENIDFVECGTSTVSLKYIAGGAGADNGKILNVKISDTDGDQANNLAAIEIHTSSNILIQSAEVHDAYDRTHVGSLTENNTGILMFRVDAPVIRGAKVINANPRSNCIKLKHQDSTALTAPEIDAAMCWNTGVSGGVDYVFGFNGSVNVHDSWAGGHSATTPFVHLRDLGGSGNFEDPFTVSDNTCENCILELNPSKDTSGGTTTFGGMTFARNVITNTAGSGNTVELCDDGNDSYFTDYITGGKFTFEDNCWYTPSVTFATTVFGKNDGSASLCGTGASTSSGTTYASFAAWTGAGYDSGSFNENPNLTSSGLAQSANCSTFGIAAAAAPTPTPTPTPTPDPSAGTAAFFPGVY